MNARQLTLEEQNQCHGLSDGGHCMTECHDPVFMLFYIIKNMFREKRSDIIVRVIST